MNEIFSALGWLATLGVITLVGWGLWKLLRRPRQAPTRGLETLWLLRGNGSRSGQGVEWLPEVRRPWLGAGIVTGPRLWRSPRACRRHRWPRSVQALRLT